MLQDEFDDEVPPDLLMGGLEADPVDLEWEDIEDDEDEEGDENEGAGDDNEDEDPQSPNERV